MSIEIFYLVIFALFLIFLLLGMHIHTVLLSIGVLGIIILEGPSYITTFMQVEPYRVIASYTLTTIPLFVLMAQFIVQSRIVSDLYLIVYKLSKGKSGLLGVLSVIIGAFLGGVSGSTTGSSAALGQVAVPELRKHGFRDDIAGSTIAAAGSLSGIIPPSIVLILYGVVTETPIGTLFIGAIIPGLIMTIVIILVMLFLYNRDIKKRSVDILNEPAKTTEDLSLSRSLIVIGIFLAIMAVIFGGIYSGTFTPTEAGAIGAILGLLTAFFLGKVNKQFFINSFSGTIKISSMVLLIMVTAQIFGRFITISQLPRELIGFLGPLIEYPVLMLVFICFIYFVLFMFIEGGAVIIMATPILLPIIQEMNVDLLWFGILVSVICTIGLLTPPVGLSVFAVSGVTGISIERLFIQTSIFAVVLAIVVCGLMIAFPPIVTWLPSLM
ncbi:TRAP transporter large permease [Geomicrobium sediminis]|uniref:Tripartite ATP-independent transporter DctM subunit n=1 Tax=Geomicrobium sediminis TaxID=1347788 RepID=A0ABS2PCN1_9BACL|nr:TRAP transporter large permease [Geomicrobium sediminis]MBM7633200.1 tripartite ATP-independent transporter DctM subunit [Geomicrobium sediminis]